MNRKSLSNASLIIAASVALLCAGAVKATLIPAITQDSNDTQVGDNYPSADYSIGYEFKVGAQNLTVTALGVWDGDSTDGLLTGHPVAIWTATGTLQGNVVTVPAGTGTVKLGEYRYADLNAPLTLLANTNYRIAAYMLGDYNHASLYDDFGTPGDGIDPDWPVFAVPDVSYVQRALNGPVGGLVFPDGGLLAGSSGWDAPNFLFVVPEPASGGIVALGGLTLLRRRR